MVDEGRWWRLLCHLLDECMSDNIDPIVSERAAVLIYAAVHHRIDTET